MGVKSTVNLTRRQAIERMVDLHIAANRRKIKAFYTAMGDRQIEDEFERMNDEAKGGEGFDNYTIIGDDQ